MNYLDYKKRKFDAIVIGSGISGSWAAKELCEKGLRTLVIERGEQIDHVTGYKTANLDPWDLPNRNQHTADDVENNPIQSTCYAFNDGTRHLFVRDAEHPYEQKRPFEWIRGYHVGGKSLMWARQCYRWSDDDFTANARDGVAIDWPIRYKDLAPWYSYVEKYIGVSGSRDGVMQVPDGEFLPPIEMTAAERHFQSVVKSKYQDRTIIHGRSANLTKSINGRTPCQFRHLCHRGCPFGAYFSANGVTLPAAERTGKMKLITDTIVQEIIYDPKKQRATGVRVINSITKEVREYYAKVIFVNAGTINTTAILMNSVSVRFQNGLGNDSGVLGHYMMDHCFRGRVNGEYDGLLDHYHKGRRPTGFYIPRFRNVGRRTNKDFMRGYAVGGNCERNAAWQGGAWQDGFGADFKSAMTKLGGWGMGLYMQGEAMPDFNNQMRINRAKLDKWGMPTIEMDANWGANEELLVKDALVQMREMLEVAGFKNITVSDNQEKMGRGIHEMGTARMGRDPQNSILNGNNQMHAVKNVFVTDGACMTSSATQNPSLTYMALTARAADFAVKQMKAGAI